MAAGVVRGLLGRWLGSTYEVLCKLREKFLRLLIRYGRMNDNVVTLLPVDRGRDAVLVTELQGINNSDDFVLQAEVNRQCI